MPATQDHGSMAQVSSDMSLLQMSDLRETFVLQWWITKKEPACDLSIDNMRGEKKERITATKRKRKEQMKKSQRKHVSMDIKVKNEKNEQDQVTQKWKKKKSGRPQISPWQHSTLEERTMPKKTSRKGNITSQFYIWQNCSLGTTKKNKNKTKKDK